MEKKSIKLNLCSIAQSLHQKNMLAAADGNLSYRMSDEEILITPSGVSKSKMKPEDMAIINIQGQVISGNPSSEMLMHLKVYQNCAKAKAVIHAHPPVATAWSIAKPDLKELPAECISELILACGSIPIVPFAFPGTEEMGTHLSPFLPKNRVMILARHGALCWGEDLDEAHRGMERLEHAAIVLKNAVELGGLTYLSEDQVKKLHKQRQQIGEKVL
jgi:L-fuculose-phosphate aldolase